MPDLMHGIFRWSFLSILLIKNSIGEWHCGAGPVTGMCAFVTTASCDHEKIDQCCWTHDRCYEKLHLNQTYCDDEFCNCLDAIPGNAYCETLGQPSLCLATRVFGHNFHWSAQKNETVGEDSSYTKQSSSYSSLDILMLIVYATTLFISAIFIVFYLRYNRMARLVHKLLDFEMWE